jgi:hypothetical protein
VTSEDLSRIIALCYKIVLGALLVSFFALRLYFDLPGTGTLAPVAGREDAVKWYGWLIGNFLLVIDVVVAVPTLRLFTKYARYSAMPEAMVRRRIAELQD